MESQSHQVPSWATCNPFTVNEKSAYKMQVIVKGKWKETAPSYTTVIDPLNGDKFLQIPNSDEAEIMEFVESSKQCPKSGMHNMFKKPERYMMWGDLFFKIAAEMRKPEVELYFAQLIQRVMPKSMTQCKGEVIVTRRFFENFAGDNVRILMRSFGQAGDYLGQVSNGFRWPYGPVLVISLFNFPLEIPALQVFGAVIAGNKPILKVATKVAVVMEQFFRMCHHVGMDKSEIDLIAAQPQMMDLLIAKADFRCIQFTGSSELAEKISKQTNGKVQMEDAGFDWKVFGADLGNVEYAAYQCDQDAYAASGQKCSAQSIAYIHKNWVKAGLIEKMKEQAAKRKLADLSVGPVLSWNNKQISEHIEAILKIPGAKILFGGKPIEGTKVPECYGLFEPTAIFVPIEQISAHAKIVFTELFGPFQIITEWEDSQLDLVLHHLESISLHLTAGVVSNDPVFVNKVIGSTVNGTTYTGLRARTTGAPQNHWFGPCGDPRGAGIGTKEAILKVWTCHREVINDNGPIPENWKLMDPN